MLKGGYGLFAPGAMAAFLWLLSIWIGIVLGRPEWALAAAALFVLFAAFNVLCNRIVIGVFERFQSTRKGRERMVAILLVLMLLPQMFNLVVNGWVNSRRLSVPPWTYHLLTALRRLLPPGPGP